MYLTFAEQVRVILKQRQITIEQLAEKLGVSRQNLNQKLNRNNFDEQTMRSIAIALECDFFISLNGINIGQQAFSGAITQQVQRMQQQPEKRRSARPANTDNQKEKESKVKGIKINPKYANLVKYKEEYENQPGMDVFDEDYPEHKPGTKVVVEEYTKWKLDLFNRPQIPVPSEDLLPPDNDHQWRISINSNGDRYWEFAYSSGRETYWMYGPAIDFQGTNYVAENPYTFSGSLTL